MIASIPELILYGFLNYIPYLVLVIYPFANMARFSKAKTAAIFCSFSVLTIFIFVLGARLDEPFSSLCTPVITLIGICFYFLAVKARWRRMFFNMFVVKNVANFVVVVSKCIQGIVFPSTLGTEFCKECSLCIFLVMLPTMPIIVYLMNKFFSQNIRDSIDPSVWRPLWLVPVFFYLIWRYIFFFQPDASPTEIALRPISAAFMLIFICGQFLSYICIAKLVISFNAAAMLQVENNSLSAQAIQYRGIQERIKEISRVKHDMRHQLVTLSNYADAGEYEKLKIYLHSYMDSFPDSRISYCSNMPLNMLLVYYAQKCLDKNITFNTDLKIPHNITLSDSDTTIIFGNMLENAVDACTEVADRTRFISVKGKIIQNRMVFIVANTFNNAFLMEDTGDVISTKHDGYGMGIASIRSIAEKYGGTAEFSTENNIFTASIVVPVKKTIQPLDEADVL